MPILHPMTDHRDPPVLHRVPLPVRAVSEPDALLCTDVLSRAIDKWGAATVARAFQLVLAAEGQDIEGVTLDALAQGEERQ